MRRSIRIAFENGTLSPESELVDLKHIGPYLYRRLKKEFAPSASRLTVKRFISKIKRLSFTTLKQRLQKSLQNRRSNECVRSTNNTLYHVPDLNEKAYEAIICLIKVLAFDRGIHFTFDASQFRKPPRRSDIAKTISCTSRRNCQRLGGEWNNNLCMPRQNVQGFSGIYPHSGQKMYRRDYTRPLGSLRNSVRRGRYSKSRTDSFWRRPGTLRKIR